jgi:hypothetical protein
MLGPISITGRQSAYHEAGQLIAGVGHLSGYLLYHLPSRDRESSGKRGDLGSFGGQTAEGPIPTAPNHYLAWRDSLSGFRTYLPAPVGSTRSNFGSIDFGVVGPKRATRLAVRSQGEVPNREGTLLAGS